MNWSAAADAMIRRRLLEDVYDRMTDEEKRLFAEMTMQEKSHTEVMSALRRQQAQLGGLQRTQQTFAEDFASNLLGNAIWAGAEWLAARLRKLV